MPSDYENKRDAARLEANNAMTFDNIITELYSVFVGVDGLVA